jgi:hypothetical protein
MRLPTSLALLLVFSSFASAQMTHEETVVRGAYARLKYAVNQATISQLAFEATGAPTPEAFASLPSDQRIANSEITITLGNFTVGDAKTILGLKVIQLVTPATSEKLDVQPGRSSIISEGREFQSFHPSASWRPASPPPPELADLNLEEFLASQWADKPPAAWQTYASYSVTVGYQGKLAGPYQALFLFGHNSNGNEVVEPEDGTIDARALAAVMREHLFADAFLSTSLRDIPLVRQWVDAHAQPQLSAGQCFAEQGLCCDLARLECGPSQATVEKARSLRLPLEPPKKGGAQ